MKKCGQILAYLLILISIVAPKIISAEGSTVDQACLSERTNYFNVSIKYHDVLQVFTPTKDTLDSVVLGLKSGDGESISRAFVRVMNITPPSGESLVAEQYISVSQDNYYIVDFDDVKISSGIYAIMVGMINADEPVIWTGTSGDCYDGGFANIDGDNYENIDMVFAVKTYSSENNENDEDEQDQAPDNNPDTQQDNGTAISENELPSSSEIINSNPYSNVSLNEDLSNANKDSDYAARLMADKELRDSIAEILKDAEEHRYEGAFGLSGAVGRFLTWPVFYGICVILFIIVLFKIIRYIRKPKSKQIVKTDKNE